VLDIAVAVRLEKTSPLGQGPPPAAFVPTVHTAGMEVVSRMATGGHWPVSTWMFLTSLTQAPTHRSTPHFFPLRKIKRILRPGLARNSWGIFKIRLVRINGLKRMISGVLPQVMGFSEHDSGVRWKWRKRLPRQAKRPRQPPPTGTEAWPRWRPGGRHLGVSQRLAPRRTLHTHAGQVLSRHPVDLYFFLFSYSLPIGRGLTQPFMVSSLGPIGAFE
jgi:hypothetical protein